MKVLALSEHYLPRIGGTVNYLHETLSALDRRHVSVELWVPGPEPRNWLPKGIAPPQYSIRWIEAGYPANGEPSREQRYRFCNLVNEEAQMRARGPNRPDILHVFFGLFMMEMLDTKALLRAGVPTLATIHNVPPQECRQVEPESPFAIRIKEELRLKIVALKNRKRLRAHRYDKLIVPSETVRKLLNSILPGQDIWVIGHGPTRQLTERMRPPEIRRPSPNSPVRLLTVGGWAPHKRQHLIPAIAQSLLQWGIDFEWDLVGPSERVAGYQKRIVSAIEQLGLGHRIRVHGAVPIGDLAALYDAAHIYVQPSVEEGFCITALDAATAGLPVISSRAGALGTIAQASGGLLVDQNPDSLRDAIIQFVKYDMWPSSPTAVANQIRAIFNWEKSASCLIKVYDALTESRDMCTARRE